MRSSLHFAVWDGGYLSDRPPAVLLLLLLLLLVLVIIVIVLISDNRRARQLPWFGPCQFGPAYSARASPTDWSAH